VDNIEYNIDRKGELTNMMKPQIALTFDDGPSEHMMAILDVLERYDATASFFVQGDKVEAGISMIKRAINMKCEIISHSWSHCNCPNLSELTTDEIKKELMDTQDAIKRVAGFNHAIFRPPYGAVSDTLKDVAEELGLSIILWTVDSWDWKSRNENKIYDEIFNNLRARDVILCHDDHATTASAMKSVVPDLLKKYEMVTVSTLMKHDGFVPGVRVVYPLGKIKYDN
jgi:peptidoglycan/xylan/chitin deacetylase (PgdA/CDA1 family)